jgi:hypothetical protein
MGSKNKIPFTLCRGNFHVAQEDAFAAGGEVLK